MRGKRREFILLQKIIYTAYIFCIYILGTNIPLYGIDISQYIEKDTNINHFLLQSISGDLNQCSIFILGVFPYMISSLIVQVLFTLQTEDTQKRVSNKRKNIISLFIALIISAIQSFVHLKRLMFIFPIDYQLLGYTVVFWEMVAGSMVIIMLCSMNKKYGLGGQTIIILANILRGMINGFTEFQQKDFLLSIIISLFIMIIMIIMENTEIRIPLQRISIHNIYADKNYLAIKFNPIGITPAMFTSAFFLLPQLLVRFALYFFPQNRGLLWWEERLVLTEGMGIFIYIVILYILTVSLSFLFINPKDITEQFLKSGDCLLGIHMGKETKRYLRYVVLVASFFSATIMGICLATPLYFQYIGKVEGISKLLPSSMMMLTGIMCSFLREIDAIKNMESYKPFI